MGDTVRCVGETWTDKRGAGRASNPVAWLRQGPHTTVYVHRPAGCSSVPTCSSLHTCAHIRTHTRTHTCVRVQVSKRLQNVVVHILHAGEYRIPNNSLAPLDWLLACTAMRTIYVCTSSSRHPTSIYSLNKVLLPVNNTYMHPKRVSFASTQPRQQSPHPVNNHDAAKAWGGGLRPYTVCVP